MKEINEMWTRGSLANIIRLQSQVFQKELYKDIEDDAQLRVFTAAVNVFELCARLVEGTSSVGYMDEAEGGLLQ